MPAIPVTDRLGLKIDLQFDDASEAARLGLKALASKTSEFVEAAGKPLDRTPFRSAVFGGEFSSPPPNPQQELWLVAKSGASVEVAVFRAGDKSLFASGDGSPDIAIAANQAWLRVSIDVSLAAEGALTTPSGLGLAGKTSAVRQVGCYVLFNAGAEGFPTLLQAVEQTLSHLRVLRSAADLRTQAAGTVLEWDASGKFTFESTFQYPLAIDAAALASLPLPLGAPPLLIQPGPALSVAGALSVTGEFRGRSYRPDQARAQLGLYKKKGTDFTASFQAQAGVAVGVGTTDLAGALLTLVGDPNLNIAALPEADRKAIDAALNASLDTGFTIAVNAASSAGRSDEAAILYELDLTQPAPALDAALAAALHGNWTALARSPGARELRNVATATRTAERRTSLNLLGIYNCASIAQFLRQSTVLHDRATGAITVTDKETAQRISVASEPLASDDEKLRRLLDECFLATATYAAGLLPGTAGNAATAADQHLTVYAARISGAALRKALLLGRALQLVTADELAAVAVPSLCRYFRLAARASYDGQVALRLFFSDVAARVPRRENDLITLGRQVLVTLLDTNDEADHRRIAVLTSDAAWSAMARDRQFPPDSPASYSDWYDITFWAHALATAAPVLTRVLAAADNLHGADPGRDAPFTAARQALARTLAEVTRDAHAAFEKGWPLAVMFALSGGNASVTWEAQWDGRVQFERSSPRTMTA